MCRLSKYTLAFCRRAANCSRSTQVMATMVLIDAALEPRVRRFVERLPADSAPPTHRRSASCAFMPGKRAAT